MEIYLIPVAHASTFETIVGRITDLLNLIIPILFGIATIVFFWGIILYVISQGDEEKRKEGRNFIIYGLIGLFVMIAVWGIVNLLIGFFFPGGTGPAPRLPDIPGASRFSSPPPPQPENLYDCVANPLAPGC